jgi:hypothetical protein
MIEATHNQRSNTLRRISRTTLGAIGGGVILAASLFAGLAPTGAGAASSSLIKSTTLAASPKSTPAVTNTGTSPLAPLEALPINIALPISLLHNVIAGTLAPDLDSTSGSNTTTQKSPLANVSAPVNLCSVSAGILADAASSCSTTSVGITQLGAIGNVNVPITAQDNAVGLLGMAASALGLNTTTSSASTTQNGAINAAVPVTLCSINVGLVGNTASACNTAGSNGVTTQSGVIDANVPVTVCSVIVEIADDSTASCPQNADTVHQSGELADLDVPAGVCGVIVEIDGTGKGDCMPVAGTPTVNGLPVDGLTQSAPIDGVLPINACSIVIAIAGTASNQCEPAHIAASQTGTAPINVPVTACAIAAAVQGTATGTCTGAGSTGLPIGLPGTPGTGVSLPITLCGIEAALGGGAAGTCPQPAATVASTPPTTLPIVSTLATVKPAAKAPALAFTGAPLVLELVIGLMALLAGWGMTLLSRRQRGLKPRHAATTRS